MAVIREFRDPNTNIRSIMLDALSGTGSSGWCSIESRDKGSILFAISGTATIEVRGSNKFVPDDDSFVPNESDDGILLGTVTAADPSFTWSKPLKWIKTKVTANSGTVSAWLTGV